jgi:PIN domain
LFANRYTAFLDASSLAGALKRDLLLTLAWAAFFRARWSLPVLDETEAAIRTILKGKAEADPAGTAARARAAMERAFPDAMVEGFESFLPICSVLPDPNDAHGLAAAMQTRADVLVTDNLRDFPGETLAAFNIEVRSADEFIADAAMLDPGRAVPAVRRMRERYQKPLLTSDQLLLLMEARGLLETAAALKDYVESL